MRDHYDFANMKGEENPYTEAIKQQKAVRLDRAEAHKLVDQLPDDAT